MIELRHYQQKAFDQVRTLFNNGEKRVLIQAATGSGKTRIFSAILARAHEIKRPCILVVRGRALVDQASRRLDEVGIPHGVFMAGDKRQDDTQVIQVASVDTCRARKQFPPAKIVVIDEAHYAGSKTFLDFLSHYEDASWLSVTATPWTEAGLEHLADDKNVIYPISIENLIKEGFLCPAKYYLPSNFDASKIALKSGEFDDASSISQFDKQGIIGDVVKHYEKYCLGECTFLYAINIAHAESISKSFTSAGYDNFVITGDDSLELRNKVLTDHNLIISVGTLTTGVDLPRLKNIILCRPTTSKNLYVQMLGRGTRIHPGKDHFKVLDHVGNVLRFGFIIDEQKASLKPKQKKPPKEKRLGEELGNKLKICPNCRYINDRFSDECEECGHDFTKEKVKIKTIDGDLVEVDLSLKDRMKLRCTFFLEEAWGNAYNDGWIWVKTKEEFGEDATRQQYLIIRSARAQYERWDKNIDHPPKPKGWKKLNKGFWR